VTGVLAAAACIWLMTFNELGDYGLPLIVFQAPVLVVILINIVMVSRSVDSIKRSHVCVQKTSKFTNALNIILVLTNLSTAVAQPFTTNSSSMPFALAMSVFLIIHAISVYMLT